MATNYSPGNFGHFLKARRERMELTQKQLSDLTGIKKEWISDMECGRRTPQALDVLNRLASALKLPVFVLILSRDKLIPFNSDTEIAEVQRWHAWLLEQIELIQLDIEVSATREEVITKLSKMKEVLASRPRKSYDQFTLTKKGTLSYEPEYENALGTTPGRAPGRSPGITPGSPQERTHNQPRIAPRKASIR